MGRLGLVALFTSFGAVAQQVPADNSFDALQREVEHLSQTRSSDELDAVVRTTSALQDCTESALRPENSRSSSPRKQYIFNAFYEWRSVPVEGGVCIVLDRPEQRALTKNEAQYLLAASTMEFPVGPTNSTEILERPAAIHDSNMPAVTLTSGQQKKK